MTHDDDVTVTQDPKEEGGRWWAKWRDPIDKLTVTKWGRTPDEALTRLANDIEANYRLDAERKVGLLAMLRRMAGERA